MFEADVTARLEVFGHFGEFVGETLSVASRNEASDGVPKLVAFRGAGVTSPPHGAVDRSDGQLTIDGEPAVLEFQFAFLSGSRLGRLLQRENTFN